LYLHVINFKVISTRIYKPPHMSLIGFESSPDLILWKCFKKLRGSALSPSSG